MSTPITPSDDSRLAQLREQYYQLKPEADRLSGELKQVTDAIKVELMNAAPDETKVFMPSGQDGVKGLQLSAQTSWRLDSKKLKAESPETWVRYAYQATSWTLKQASE